MLDRKIQTFLSPTLSVMAKALVKLGFSANAVSLIGFACGIAAAASIASQYFLVGAVLIGASRLFDGLDGAVARATQPTDLGGFLDITLDFLFYASIPLAFAFANPLINAIPATVLLAAFIGTGSSFLAFAAIAAKRGIQNSNYPNKSFYFIGGLTEATETIVVFVAMCLWPNYFYVFAYSFSVLCLITIVMRLAWGYRVFK